MNKIAIQDALKKHHTQFIELITQLSTEEIVQASEGKWSAGQQYEHIYLSIRPLAQGLGLPKFILKRFFGKANRHSKSNQELIDQYLRKLENGGVATARFTPQKITTEKIPALTKKIDKTVQQLIRNLNKFNEKELDEYIAPHPLLGKLTLREMMYFTIYHVQHHHQIIKNQLLK